MAAAALNRAKRLHAYLRRQPSGVPGPAGISIETTVRCNLTCPMCPRTGGGYPQADMPDDLLYRLIEAHAALGGETVYLYGLGEPLMDSRIFDILKACQRAGLSTLISTNASFLDDRRRAQLLKVGCDHLICSIDGVTPATYARYRPGGDFHRVVSQVEALAREKAAAQSPMHLVVQMVRMKGNQHEEAAFLKRWGAVRGIDGVRLKEEELGFDALGLVQADGDARVNPCHILWRGPLIVRWNGDVYPCHPFAATEEAIGNLHEASLGQIWSSEPMVALRRGHGARPPGDHPRCQSCPIARPRLPFIVGALAVDGPRAQRLIPTAERLARRARGLFQERRRSSSI